MFYWTLGSDCFKDLCTFKNPEDSHSREWEILRSSHLPSKSLESFFSNWTRRAHNHPRPQCCSDWSGRHRSDRRFWRGQSHECLEDPEQLSRGEQSNSRLASTARPKKEISILPHRPHSRRWLYSSPAGASNSPSGCLKKASHSQRLE